MDYSIKVSKDKYYKAALSLMNCFLKLTEFELDLIITMLNHNIKSISKDSRIILRDLLSKDSYTFNNYIKRLKDKKALIEVNEELVINPNITKSIVDDELNVKIYVNRT